MSIGCRNTTRPTKGYRKIASAVKYAIFVSELGLINGSNVVQVHISLFLKK